MSVWISAFEDTNDDRTPKVDLGVHVKDKCYSLAAFSPFLLLLFLPMEFLCTPSA